MKWKIAAISAAIIASPAIADWDEGIDGDLSDFEATPTFIAMGVGDNFVSGIIGGDDFNDAFTFTIGAGQSLEGIDVVTYMVSGGNTSTGFNMAFGSSWDGDFNNPALIASIAMGTSYVGTNLLDDPAFGGPLGPGDYTVGLREGTAGQVYSFNFRVTPTPGTASLLGLGALVGVRRRR
jgi:hypothetical protein